MQQQQPQLQQQDSQQQQGQLLGSEDETALPENEALTQAIADAEQIRQASALAPVLPPRPETPEAEAPPPPSPVSPQAPTPKLKEPTPVTPKVLPIPVLDPAEVLMMAQLKRTIKLELQRKQLEEQRLERDRLHILAENSALQIKQELLRSKQMKASAHNSAAIKLGSTLNALAKHELLSKQKAADKELRFLKEEKQRRAQESQKNSQAKAANKFLQSEKLRLEQEVVQQEKFRMQARTEEMQSDVKVQAAELKRLALLNAEKERAKEHSTDVLQHKMKALMLDRDREQKAEASRKQYEEEIEKRRKNAANNLEVKKTIMKDAIAKKMHYAQQKAEEVEAQRIAKIKAAEYRQQQLDRVAREAEAQEAALRKTKRQEQEFKLKNASMAAEKIKLQQEVKVQSTILQKQQKHAANVRQKHEQIQEKKRQIALQEVKLKEIALLSRLLVSGKITDEEFQQRFKQLGVSHAPTISELVISPSVYEQSPKGSVSNSAHSRNVKQMDIELASGEDEDVEADQLDAAAAQFGTETAFLGQVALSAKEPAASDPISGESDLFGSSQYPGDADTADYDQSFVGGEPSETVSLADSYLTDSKSSMKLLPATIVPEPNILTKASNAPTHFSAGNITPRSVGEDAECFTARQVTSRSTLANGNRTPVPGGLHRATHLTQSGSSSGTGGLDDPNFFVGALPQVATPASSTSSMRSGVVSKSNICSVCLSGAACARHPKHREKYFGTVKDVKKLHKELLLTKRAQESPWERQQRITARMTRPRKKKTQNPPSVDSIPFTTIASETTDIQRERSIDEILASLEQKDDPEDQRAAILLVLNKLEKRHQAELQERQENRNLLPKDELLRTQADFERETERLNFNHDLDIAHALEVLSARTVGFFMKTVIKLLVIVIATIDTCFHFATISEREGFASRCYFCIRIIVIIV